ncbi:MAG: RNA polymerase sigma-70 factor [Cyclobacteriaceae bacterium]
MSFLRKTKKAEFDLRTPRGFEQIYQTYSEKMYKIGYSQTGDAEVTREIIQDIFTSLWERRKKLNIQGAIEPYLMRALKYRVIDHFRSQTKREHHQQQATVNYCESDNCTEEEVAYRELKSNITALVDQLPAQCRRVYQMSREQGLSNREIASMLLISERAVAYHVAKGTAFLQGKLRSYQSL